jgi:hypothetical protein
MKVAGLNHPHTSPMSSARDFLNAFRATAWNTDVVLLLDELSELYHSLDVIRNDFLRALREIRNNNMQYSLRSVIAAGTFSIIHLNPTNYTSSSFNVSERIMNPYFSFDETKKLFYEYAHDNAIVIGDDVIHDVWARAGGCVAQLHASYILAHVCSQPSRYGMPLRACNCK